MRPFFQIVFTFLLAKAGLAAGSELVFFRLENSSSEAISEEMNRVVAEVDPHHAILLREAFVVIAAYAKETDSPEVWELLDGKSANEIIQHAVFLRNRNLEEILSIGRWRLDMLQKEMLRDPEPSEGFRASLKEQIDELEREIRQIEVFGKPLVSDKEFESAKTDRARFEQALKIEGKWKSLFEEALVDCDRIEILSTMVWSDTPGERLYAIDGREAVEEFLNIVEFEESKPGASVHDMCDGDAVLVFSSDRGKAAEVAYNHGYALRWNESPWFGDANLTKECQIPLLEWFSRNGFPLFEEKNRERIEKENTEEDG